LGEVVLHSEAGKSLKADEVAANPGEWGVVKTSAITTGNFSETKNKKFKNLSNNFKSIKIYKGDIIFCRASGSKGLAGISCIVEEQPAPELILSDKTIRFHFGEGIIGHFINLYNSSSFAKDYYMNLGTGKSTSMNNITREQFYHLPIPVPPTIVQNKILERIQYLVGYSQELEQNIQKGKDETEKLLQQVLTDVLNK
jgi:type I restriction enzyme S subunit